MSEASGAAGVLELEQQMPTPAPDVMQGMGEIGVSGDARRAQGEASPLVPVVPEMSAPHTNIDPQTLTRDGLIKACPYFASIAAKNPALAEKLADGALQAAQHKVPGEMGPADPLAALREQRKQKAAERAKARAAKESIAEAEPARSEPVEETATPAVIRETPAPTGAATPIRAETPAPAAISAPKPEKTVKKEVPRPEIIEVTTAPVVAAPAELPAPKIEVVAPVVLPELKPAPPPVTEVKTHKIIPVVLPAVEPVRVAAPAPTIETTTSYEPKPPVMAEVFPAAETTADFAELTFPPLPEIAVTAMTASPVEAAIETMAEAPAIQPAAEQVTWADELDKEPEDLYNNFTEALQVFVAPARQEPSIAAEANIENKPNAEVPPIAVTVAERLTTIEPAQKETVVPVVHDVVIAIQAVEALMIQKAEPEAVEAAVVQLKEQVVELFEQLGIEYVPQDIEQFMRVLFRPDFVPPRPEPAITQTVNLETDGTHEAKSPWMHWGATVWGEVERDMQHLLGSFALFTYLALPPMQTVTADN
jgi:hypothetical protein